MTGDQRSDDHQIIVLTRSGEPAATAIHHPTLMCFLPAVPVRVARDIARQYGQYHNLTVLPGLMPPGLLSGEDREAIARAYADDPELTCVVHQYGPPGGPPPEMN
jgi:hypothetical protein